MPTFVLDSWPLLEFLRDREPASTQFRDLLRQVVRDQSVVHMSRINLGEVYYKAVPYSGEPAAHEFVQIIESIVYVVSVDDDLVYAAALLKGRFAVSYADCFAATLGMRLNAPVVTGDPDFRQLQAAGLIDVKWLGA